MHTCVWGRDARGHEHECFYLCILSFYVCVSHTYRNPVAYSESTITTCLWMQQSWHLLKKKVSPQCVIYDSALGVASKAITSHEWILYARTVSASMTFCQLLEQKWCSWKSLINYVSECLCVGMHLIWSGRAHACRSRAQRTCECELQPVWVFSPPKKYISLFK